MIRWPGVIKPGTIYTEMFSALDSVPTFVWNDGPSKQAILNFVKTTTDKTSSNFVSPEQRIAEFDQGWHAVGRAARVHAGHLLPRACGPAREKEAGTEERQPFKTVLSGDREEIAKLTIKELFEIVIATQSGMTVESPGEEAL